MLRHVVDPAADVLSERDAFAAGVEASLPGAGADAEPPVRASRRRPASAAQAGGDVERGSPASMIGLEMAGARAAFIPAPSASFWRRPARCSTSTAAALDVAGFAFERRGRGLGRARAA